MSETEKVLLDRERNALERERLAEERRKEVEEALSKLSSKRTLNWAVFGPVLVAAIGATASVVVTAVSHYYQSENARLASEAELLAQSEAAQQELIRLSVSAEPGRADANLRFLVSSGLVETYASGIQTAMNMGERLSIPSSEQEVCGAPGCFVPPLVSRPGQTELGRIFGNYDGDEGESHANANAGQFCKEKGYQRASDFDVSCEGEDESGYLAYSSEQQAWRYIGTGSSNSYCYPLITWVRCN